jgi:hypothetical protein
LDISPEFHAEAWRRGISTSLLARRLWGVVLRDNLTSAILDTVVPARAGDGVGASVAALRAADVAAVDASSAVAFSIVIQSPRLIGCTSPLR